MAATTLDQALERQEALAARFEKALDTLEKPQARPVNHEARSEWDLSYSPQGEAKLGARGMYAIGPKFHVSPDYRPYQIWKTNSGWLRDYVNAAKNPVGSHARQFHESMEKCFAIEGKAIQGMSTRVGEDGGVAVIPEFSKQIFDRVYANDLLSKTDGYPATGNSMVFKRSKESSRATGSRAGGLQAYWTAEGGSTTATKPGLEDMELKLKKLVVIVYLTEELIADNGLALETYVARKVAEEIEFMVGDALIEGNGAGMPLGILNAGCLVTVAAESGPQTADTIVPANIDKMWSRLIASSAPRAEWYINQDCTPQLNQMAQAVGTAGGQVLYRPPGGLSDAPYGTLMGRPVKPLEFCSTIGDVGDIILADFSQYATLVKGGLEQAESMHVEFLTGQMALRFTFRVDGQPWDKTAITPFKGTNTVSPFVALAAR